MRFKCPRCQSNRIEIRNYATITCSIIGAIAGGISGAIGSAGNRSSDTSTEPDANSTVLNVSEIASAIIGGLIGAMTGGAAGAKLGAFVDGTILPTFHCKACGHRHGKNAAPQYGGEFFHADPTSNPHQQNSAHDFAGDQEGDLDFA